ncbi:MAG TPA: hypothetical protein VI197_24980 [Polyangiaceae bacterium]
MVKRSGPGTSRAARKAARARKQRAEERGLPAPPPAVTSMAQIQLPRARARQAASEAQRSRFPLLAKVAVFVALLMAVVWWAARYRHALLD